MKLDVIRTAALVVALAGMARQAAALGTAFTYQGQLLHDGSPTTDTCDFQFSLFDSKSGSMQLGSMQPVSPVTVTNGVFDVQLNGGGQFGASAFTGGDRWLQIAVRCPVGNGNYTTLAPLQPLTATPYALYAPAAGSANSLTCTGCVGPTVLAPNAVTDQSVASGISYGKLSGAPTALPPSGAAGGSLSGTYPNPSIQTGAVGPLQLQDNAVTGAKVADGSLTTADIDFTTGNINLANSTASMGTVLKNGSPFIHNFGSENTFVGVTAGNFSMTGYRNTGVGASALSSNSSGVDNTALGDGALHGNTAGVADTAVGSSALVQNTTGNGNTAVGWLALATNTTGGSNTAIGAGALQDNTTGGENAAVGLNALVQNTTGSSNTAVGWLALTTNTGSNGCAALHNPDFCCTGAGVGSCGSSNAAVGSGALLSNTTGSNNTAMGQAALQANTTGSRNTAMGQAALLANTTGGLNTAVGNNVLLSNLSGSRNVAVGGGEGFGPAALQTNTTGTDNTAVGLGALYRNTTGSYNIALGEDAGESIKTGTYNIDIGDCLDHGDESNTIRLGCDMTATFISGISGATSSGGTAVFVNAAGQLGTITSSARFKEDIQDMGDSTSALLSLRPVRFRYKRDIDPSGLEQYGLVAEEVAKIYPDLVAYDDQGRPQTVRYHFVNAMLLNEVQKQARQIATLTARLERLEAAADAPEHTQAAPAVADRSIVPNVTANPF